MTSTLSAAGIRAALSAAAGTLSAAGVPGGEREAALLAAHLLGLPPTRLAGHAGFTGAEQERFEQLVVARSRRVPLQHLTGRAYFRHLELAVGPGVFVPRPETELLVELVPAGARRVADLCAGSGAVGLALATERPGVQVEAVEADPEALDWLRRNAAAYPQAALRVHAGRVEDFHPSQPFDAVVANPPYLPAATVIAPEVSADPARALWGGPDGLATIREIAAAAGRLLRPGGLLAIEHDASHQGQVLALLSAAGLCQLRGHRDLTGRDRFVTGVLG